MKRLAPLALLVLAFAVTPVAFADDTAPAPAGHPVLRMRVEIVRLRLQLVHLRYAIVCHDKQSDRCTQFTQTVVDRLTKIDGNVQSRIDAQKCTPDSAEKKCALLAKIDARLKNVIAKLGSPSGDASSESAVDQAANALGQLAGSTQP